MQSEDILYESIFFIFLGFLIFVSIILNKIHKFLTLLDSYFVLFLFLGIILTILGIAMSINWNFINRRPYEEEAELRKKLHFPMYFIVGSASLLMGFTMQYYLKIKDSGGFIVNSINISGIICLCAGLYYFIEEVLKKSKKKTLQHSETSF